MVGHQNRGDPVEGVEKVQSGRLLQDRRPPDGGPPELRTIPEHAGAHRQIDEKVLRGTEHPPRVKDRAGAAGDIQDIHEADGEPRGF